MIENLDNEIWKDIPGYVRLYQVSNLGRVKRLESIINKFNGSVNCNHKYDEKLLKGCKTKPCSEERKRKIGEANKISVKKYWDELKKKETND